MKVKCDTHEDSLCGPCESLAHALICSLARIQLSMLPIILLGAMEYLTVEGKQQDINTTQQQSQIKMVTAATLYIFNHRFPNPNRRKVRFLQSGYTELSIHEITTLSKGRRNGAS